MDYEKKYKDAKEWIESIYPDLSHEQQMQAEVFFPEVTESDDEIRKGIIKHLILFNNGCYNKRPSENMIDNWISWLEKQDQTFTKKDVDDAWLQGMCDAKNELEKQCNNNTISPEEMNKSICRRIATSLINYLDDNRYEGAMNMSSIECEDLEKAILDSNWNKVYRYMKKKLEKQNNNIS